MSETSKETTTATDVLRHFPSAAEIREQLLRNIQEARILRSALRLASQAEKVRGREPARVG